MTTPSRSLRVYSFVDRMQPQYAAYVATVVQGDPPVSGMAELSVEMAPGNEIYAVADAALKAADVRPGTQLVEREFGLLELHAFDQSAVGAAGKAILQFLGAEEGDRLRPRLESSQVITNVDPYQAQLINKFRRGTLLLPGRTLCVMEIAPAAYAGYATNEAEKAADIDVIYTSNAGRTGRFYMAGSEADVIAGRDAVAAALASVDGRDW
jgi:ethanolamine utilization microcompartment shell protein EutL